MPSATTAPEHDSQAPGGLLNLSLDHVTDDDALQFTSFEPFSGQNSPFEFDGAMDYVGQGLGSGWATPLASCSNCITWGYQCQTARERESQGRCVPCASLGCECSFPAEASASPGASARDVGNLIGGRPPVLADSQAPPTPEASKRSSGAFEPVTNSSTSTPPPPKIGTRFSRDSTRILRQWLSSHSHHPYPSDDEKKILQHQTGLSKIQITNWLINARRRGKVQSRNRSISPYHSGSGSKPVDVPVRSGTPAPRSSPRYQALNPLERWVDSPPEHEPATVSAIARAVASSHADSSAVDGSNVAYTDEDAARSLRSSASSVGTSTSGGSFASAYSHKSNTSTGLPRPAPPRGSGRGRQRRRPKRTSLTYPRNQYQCTFCTETFRTKHDWQRHEKSLHMPLERWVCSPDGPTAADPDTGQPRCVFCGEVGPSEAHVRNHNPSACRERTFNRKDHLKQHLRLVHNAGLLDASARLWRVAIPDIRSRCGFCGASLDSWAFRADHLADHFKMGQDMSAWKGDWGFDEMVSKMVENSVPPYLIEYERFTPFPYQASGTPPESPRNAVELLTLELNHFLRLFYDREGTMPSNREIRLEACRIIFASEVSSEERDDVGGGGGGARHESWVRDLVTSQSDVTQDARFGPIRSVAESMMSNLQIKGKNSLFEGDVCERQLRAFVEVRRLAPAGAEKITDRELQSEAYRIVARLGADCGVSPADFVVNWMVNLIGASSAWLDGFRKRSRLPANQDLTQPDSSPAMAQAPSPAVDSGGMLDSQADEGFLSFLNEAINDELQTCDGNKPGGMRNQPDLDGTQPWFSPTADGFSLPPIDDAVVVPTFPDSLPPPSPTELAAVAAEPLDQTMDLNTHPDASLLEPALTNLLLPAAPDPAKPAAPDPPMWSKLNRNYAFFNDANFHRWLTLELRRWVAATMSPNNPSRHVPTDEELQHQARFIVYEDGDPWNQTSADNMEWLRHFKRDAGITAEPLQQQQQGPGPSASSDEVIGAWME
ncbi:Homeobox protein HD-2 [Colletotrichum trifolii]|uniref:Homeobox protein HD-2 n=1 Tax=Colletotrichum trifolii TaxID=5466 RepID=A0A4R8QP68_COLTR|nr:Homeobox protein HD-2 [Colletotrichum trifolii]